MKKPVKKEAEKKIELPPDVLAADVAYPAYREKTEAEYDAERKAGNELHAKLVEMVGEDHAYTARALTLHKAKGGRTGEHWSVATLPISKSRNGYADRTYAIRVDTGEVCRIGKGPHVVATLTLYIRPENFDRLKKYVELYAKGLESAGLIRDRISSRRAMGALHRANGRTHWTW